jgi:hypothetical protein
MLKTGLCRADYNINTYEALVVHGYKSQTNSYIEERDYDHD